MNSNVHITGDIMTVSFDRFDTDNYNLFLRVKKVPEARYHYDRVADRYSVTAPARFARLLGITDGGHTSGELKIASHLWDYQRYIVAVALAAKRYAIWADCGLGKTAMFLEWARHVRERTGQPVVIFSPLSIIPQTVDECRRFYGDSLVLHQLQSRTDLINHCNGGCEGRAIGIVNPDKMIAGIIDELRKCGGVVVDESQLLRSGGGVIKWNLIKSCRGIEYKLSCTATPAPNDTMEFASQASFLEKLRSEGEILWTFFQRDTKTQEWRVKPHARRDFYRFMASWSIYLRNPASYGWADNLSATPSPVVLEHEIKPTRPQLEIATQLRCLRRGVLFDDGEAFGITERTKLSQLAKGFLYREGAKPLMVTSHKPEFVADLIREEVSAGRKTLVWTVFDEESNIIREHLGNEVDAEVLSGNVSIKDRQPMLERFRRGLTPCLISKATLLGLGMNFQHCKAMVFSGWNDSYEQWYQAVRRAVRYGQTDSVRVHIPFVPELEGKVYDNIRRKQQLFEESAREMEQHYREAMGEVL